MKVETIQVVGWYAAAKGARLSYAATSLPKLDTPKDGLLGEKDVKLLSRLVANGDEQGKYVRFIRWYCEITASLKWFTQLSTYKFFEQASTSQMHTILKVPITQETFSEPIHPQTLERLQQLQQEKDFDKLVKEMPQSYLYTRIVDFNYQTLRHMHFQRRKHRWDEWHTFLSKVYELPYADELITIETLVNTCKHL